MIPYHIFDERDTGTDCSDRESHAIMQHGSGTWLTIPSESEMRRRKVAQNPASAISFSDKKHCAQSSHPFDCGASLGSQQRGTFQHQWVGSDSNQPHWRIVIQEVT